MSDIVTRFPPSPTGALHVGSARTALFNWLYARSRGGRFVLRIEDTDRARSTDESVQGILKGMEWLGMDWDEGPHFQTERLDRYREVIDQLLASGHAYHCYCSRERLDALRAEQQARKEKPRYDRRCRDGAEPVEGIDPVVRLRTPVDGEVVVDDLIRGQVVFSNQELDDLIIARSDGMPTYHLTVVVDDHDMGITDVIRGDDHLANTPRQIHILEAMGASRPRYAHMPMIAGADGKRLSKRHGAVSVLEYEEQGVLPAAMVNYLARLGWSHGDQELFRLDELISLFDVVDVHKAPARFDTEKLEWVNQQHLQQMSTAAMAEQVRPHFEALGVDLQAGPALEDVVELQRERMRTLAELAERSLWFYEDVTEFDPKAAKQHLKAGALEPLSDVRNRLAELEAWQPEAIDGAVNATLAALEVHIRKLAQPIRVAVTGAAASPSIDATLHVLGRERTLERIDRAIEFVRNRE